MWGRVPIVYPAFFLLIGDHSQQVGALHPLCGLTADSLPNALKQRVKSEMSLQSHFTSV